METISLNFIVSCLAILLNRLQGPGRGCSAFCPEIPVFLSLICFLRIPSTPIALYLALGLKPVFNVMTGFAAASLEQFVSPTTDKFLD
jgi:hypothetical protein